MNVNNFLSFSILFSCFMGAFFSILKFNHAIDIILFFLMTSFCISIILKFGIGLIVKFTNTQREKHFKHDYDDNLEKIRIMINNLERTSNLKISQIKKLNISKLINKKKE